MQKGRYRYHRLQTKSRVPSGSARIADDFLFAESQQAKGNGQKGPCCKTWQSDKYRPSLLHFPTNPRSGPMIARPLRMISQFSRERTQTFGNSADDGDGSPGRTARLSSRCSASSERVIETCAEDRFAHSASPVAKGERSFLGMFRQMIFRLREAGTKVMGRRSGLRNTTTPFCGCREEGTT